MLIDCHHSSNILLVTFGLWVDVLSDDYGPLYGEEWLYYIDDNGTSHVMNFSSEPSDSRDMFFGDVYFLLYTRSNIFEPEPLLLPDKNQTLASNYINGTNDVKIITHGWLSSGETQWLLNIKNTFLKYYDLNVITVDWSELAGNRFYPWPAYSTKHVGKEIARLIDAMSHSYNMEGSSFHLIGHSLGAQIMGYAGMFSNGNINRITGLDPARPLFEIPQMPANYRLDETDAKFVDIIHTCGGVYGYWKSFGHADFYPNSGQPTQPGCSGARSAAEACSHGRAYELFDESINYNLGTGFVAYPCENWEKFKKGECKENATNMGYAAAKESRGNYFLHTRDSPKYADTDGS